MTDGWVSAPVVDDWSRPLVGEAHPSRSGPPLPVIDLDPPDRGRAHGRPGPDAVHALIVTRALDAGGIPEVVAFLARHLPRHRVATTVMHVVDSDTERNGSSRIAESLRAEGLAVITVDATEGRLQLEAIAPDVVSAHDPPEWLLESSARLGIPVVETLHGVPTPIGTVWQHESVRSLGVRRFVAVSELVRRQYLAGNPWVPPSGVVTIPNPLGEPRQIVTDRDRARAWLGLDNQFLFVSLGRHAPQKNTYGLMTAFADVARSHPSCHLLVAGRVDDRSYAQQLVQRRERDPGLANVHLRDHSRTTPALLAAADAFVLDSFYEGGPIVTMEALVAGLPVVTSEVGAVVEQVGADGSRGFVVPNPLGSAMRADWDEIGRARYRDQPNRAALADAMCAVVDDRARWAARREALSLESIERFGADATAVPYAGVLREVAGRSATAEPVETLPPLSWRAPARAEG